MLGSTNLHTTTITLRMLPFQNHQQKQIPKRELGLQPHRMAEQNQNKLDELIEISQKLAEDIDYCRVDFFLTDDKWVFGEFTNYHNSCQPQSDK